MDVQSYVTDSVEVFQWKEGLIWIEINPRCRMHGMAGRLPIRHEEQGWAVSRKQKKKYSSLKYNFWKLNGWNLCCLFLPSHSMAGEASAILAFQQLCHRGRLHLFECGTRENHRVRDQTCPPWESVIWTKRPCYTIKV